MPRSCKVCTHPERAEIDEGLVAGVSAAEIAGRYRTIGERAIRRHRSNHLPEKLAKAREAEEVAQADDLLEQVRDLRVRALDILDKAEEAGELRIALSAIREARGNLELLAKLLGELDERPVTNVLVSAEWVTMRTAMMETLDRYPEARVAVAERLAELEAT
jgi:hypothetical protein